MDHNDSHINTLFRKYLAGAVTVHELDELLTHFGLDEHTDLLKTLIQEQFDQPLAAEVDPKRVDAMVGVMDETVLKQTAPVDQPHRRWRTFAMRALPYAAAALLMISVSIWLYVDTKQGRTGSEPTIVDIAPGGSRAVLTLADGRVISLDSTQNGIVVAGEGITYQDGTGLVAYLAGRDKTTSVPIQMLTLSTPRGGQYRVTLPDGTQVWLNAASTLTYPSQFDRKERVVELTGEGYFLVSKNINVPFKVMANSQAVEVLGTEFNISAYEDEPLVKTTLVEGSVRVAASGQTPSLVLAPGDQSSMSGDGSLAKSRVNIKKELAWKSGLFYFEQTSFEELLRQVARWYDVAIQYKGNLPKESFSGIVNRNVTLRTLLEYLNESAVEIKLENRTLVVTSAPY